MALAYLGSCVASGNLYASGTKVDTLGVVVSRTIPVGHTLVISVVNEGSTPGQATFDVTDSAGNTASSNSQDIAGTTRQVNVIVLPILAQLNSGGTVTIDSDITRGRWAVQIEEWSGASATPVDKTAVSGGASTSVNMFGGTTAATTQADEAIIGAFATGPGETVSVTGAPATAGYALGAGAVTAFGSGDHKVTTTYKIVSSTGTQQALATQNSTGAFAGVTVTLKAAATQTLKPASDDVTTGWDKHGAASFAANINDTNDATFDTSGTAPDGSQYLQVVMSNPGTTPVAGTAALLRVRAKANAFSSASMTAGLYQGASKITDMTFTLSGSAVWYEANVTASQCATIAAGPGGFNGLKVRVAPIAV